MSYQLRNAIMDANHTTCIVKKLATKVVKKIARLEYFMAGMALKARQWKRFDFDTKQSHLSDLWCTNAHMLFVDHNHGSELTRSLQFTPDRAINTQHVSCFASKDSIESNAISAWSYAGQDPVFTSVIGRSKEPTWNCLLTESQTRFHPPQKRSKRPSMLNPKRTTRIDFFFGSTDKIKVEAE